MAAARDKLRLLEAPPLPRPGSSICDPVAFGMLGLLSPRSYALSATCLVLQPLFTALDFLTQFRPQFIKRGAECLLAVDAVQCAVVIQSTLRAENANLAQNRRMEFRIGINLGDVMVERERIYGGPRLS